MRPQMLSDMPDLSRAQFRTMVRVYQHPGCTPSELAERLGIARPTASRLVDRLVRQGLVARRTDDGDRRRVTLRLTRNGARRVEAARDAVCLQMAELLADLPEPALAAASRSLDLLAGALTARRGLVEPRGSRDAAPGAHVAGR
jgi:DNA-binding MarR family transcriptional regulator